MTPLEIESRRRRLGLSQEDLGRCLALVSPMPDGTPRKPIKQAKIAKWEAGREFPDWAQLVLPDLFDAIDEKADEMCERIEELIEHSSAVRDDPLVAVRGYETDEALWRDWPDLAGWPHILWNVAATLAMDEMREEHGIVCELVAADDPARGAD